MNDASLYSSHSSCQQRDSNIIFKEFLNVWKNDLENCESILDVGCGPGETFMNHILPLLNKKPSRLVGIDRLDEMIELANEKFSEKFLEFQVLDIQSDISTIKNILDLESFDLVTLFYVFHWIREERLNFELNTLALEFMNIFSSKTVKL